jgi:Mrp family chromosome partitioning ATPase/uncharacterized protein involved in exopolysaccharide biosynthesis
MTTQTTAQADPTVLDAVWRYKWLVFLVALGFAGLGWLYASTIESWSAEATLAVQDPRSTNLFDQGAQDNPERYVEAQVAILESRAVARRAVEIAAEQEPPIDVTVDAIVDDLSVDASASSDIVTLSFTAPTEREAIGVVNAVAAAYQDIGRQSADASFADAVSELDRSIETVQVELAALEKQLTDRQQAVLDQLATDPVRVAKQERLAELTAELDGLTAPGSGSSDGRFNQFAADLQILTLQIDTLSTELLQQRDNAILLEQGDPARAALEASQAEAQQRLTDLQARRDQLAVDADLAGTGVVFASPAETAEPSGGVTYVALGLLAGLVVGAIIAMLLAGRRQSLSSRSEPEAILGARLLADVPSFREERLRSALPVVDAPASVSAEAFRFIAASLSLQQHYPPSESDARNFGSVVTLSAGIAEGKTTVTANTALAAGREGQRVLVVDADFGNQQLTKLLLPSGTPPLGMTDVVAGAATLAKAVVSIEHNGTGSIELLSRGGAPVKAPDFFASPDTGTFFKHVADQYDLVLIDAPPLLRVAYATTLTFLADRAMIVVSHGEDVQSVAELRSQLDLIGVGVVGYIYNRAPLRPEMSASQGSMADTLGEFRVEVHND